MAWQHDMFAPEPPAIETGTKLYVSNLDYGVSNEDVKELFSEVGDVKRYGIHYDSSGRSKVPDGKRMKIELVGTNIITTPAMPAEAVEEGVWLSLVHVEVADWKGVADLEGPKGPWAQNWWPRW